MTIEKYKISLIYKHLFFTLSVIFAFILTSDSEISGRNWYFRSESDGRVQKFQIFAMIQQHEGAFFYFLDFVPLSIRADFKWIIQESMLWLWIFNIAHETPHVYRINHAEFSRS